MEAIDYLTTDSPEVTHDFASMTIANDNRYIQDQVKTLKKIVQQAKNTDYGLIHGFKDVLNSKNPIATFQERVPIVTYNEMYERWITKVLQGEKNVIWPGQIKHFALSSGTTKAGSKYIPVSDQMVRQFQKTSYQQVMDLFKNDLPKSVYSTKTLLIGGSTALQKDNAVKLGDLSGILSKKRLLVFSPAIKPGKKISQMTDWDKKMAAIVKKAPKWNVGAIAGVPSWTSMLLEKIVKEHQLNDIHEIWPNLSIYAHGGVFIQPYKERIDKLLGKPIKYQNTYLASEGYFGYQRDLQQPNMELLTKSGVFYEFVEEKYFNQLRQRNYYNVETLTIDQVKPGKLYCMIISTCSGLWRYNLGDLVEFTKAGSANFEIRGRLSYDLNVSGEHLSEDNISTAIQQTAKEFGVQVKEFCVYPNKKKDRHEWYIGTDSRVPVQAFEVKLDETLKQLNDDYRVVRKYHLKTPKIKALHIEKFYEFLVLNDKYGGQSKFPRVMTTKQVKEWEAFLSNMDSYSKGKL